MLEVWKDIAWYEWIYQVSDLWNIKNIKRNCNLCFWTAKLTEHKYIWLHKHNKRKYFFIHRLVWQAFLWLDINDRKTLVCHIDDNPANNSVDNLFLWSHKDNMQDMVNKWRASQANSKYRKIIKLLYTKYKEWKIIILD